MSIATTSIGPNPSTSALIVAPQRATGVPLRSSRHIPTQPSLHASTPSTRTEKGRAMRSSLQRSRTNIPVIWDHGGRTPKPDALPLHRGVSVSFSLAQPSHIPPSVLRLRCPACRHNGTLEAIPNVLDAKSPQPDDGNRPTYHFGIRRCPNVDCYAAVFVVHHGSNVVASYPPEVLDFDSTGLPASVLASMTEALQCHAAGCHRAAAIMVRRTLEEICSDRGAEGENLAARITALGERITIPLELLEGLQSLRLLGNDAAHITAKTYEQVGEGEVETAVDVVKLVLLTTYQYVGVIERLQALQKQGD